MPDATQANFLGIEPREVTGRDASHFTQVARRKLHVARSRKAAHGFELPRNPSRRRNARLRTAVENLSDRIEGRVIHTGSESQIKRVGHGGVVEREHLKRFENRQWNSAGRIHRRGIERKCDGASPLQGERGRDFLFGRKAQLHDPVADRAVTRAPLGFERSLHFSVRELAPCNHEQTEKALKAAPDEDVLSPVSRT